MRKKLEGLRKITHDSLEAAERASEKIEQQLPGHPSDQILLLHSDRQIKLLTAISAQLELIVILLIGENHGKEEEKTKEQGRGEDTQAEEESPST